MKDLKTNLLRFPQREQLKTDIEQAESMLPHAKPDDRGTIQANINKAKRQLQSQSPEPLTGKEKDTLAALEKKLIKRITTNMPTEEVMRKNPAGAVDWHTKWERANKPLIRMWKNIKIQLNPDNSDKDLASIERFRPSGQTNRIRTDAQIVGLHSFQNIDDEQWPFDPPGNTALEQAKRNEISEEDAEGAVNKALEEFDSSEIEEAADETDGRKRERSPEEHAVMVQRAANARAARAKKMEEEKQLDEQLNAVPEK
jgi:hypothetical protein